MTDGDADLVTIRIKRRHLWTVAALALAFVSGYAVARFRTVQPLSGAASSPQVPSANGGTAVTAGSLALDRPGRPSRGPEDAPVTIVEFTDYQCPYCARHHKETSAQLLAANEGRVRYVVRHFPIANLHPEAQKAAEAAECALDQDRFWEYHDLLFERSPRVPADSLKSFAQQVGLDLPRFEDCLDSGEKEEIVLRDSQDGQRNGVRGTPTFFINGRPIVGAQPLPLFQSEIDRAAAGR